MSLPKESLRKCVTDFFKTFKIVDFRRAFCHWRSFAVLLGQVVTTLDVLKHSSSVHFCLMNLMMISQTAQYWSSDDVFSSLRSEKEIFDIMSV